MTGRDPLKQAYQAGRAMAMSEATEKVAFLGGVAQAGKFLLGMGNLGAKGSTAARLSAHHVGMPIGFGLMGAIGADEGEKSEAFMKGLVGGAVFNAAMPLGGVIGKKLLAPGFGGKNTFGIMKRIGFADDAAGHMATSQALNKPLHGSLGHGSLGRRLDAGTASREQVRNLGESFKATTKDLGGLSEELAGQQAQIQALFDRGVLSGPEQAQLKSLYSQFTSGLYKGGYSTGTAGQRAALKGLRVAKGIGTVGGGMGLGMAASHKVEGMMDTHPASVFDARGGH
jgi:hypothetical protein